MQYRLRTLLILLAIGPPLVAGVWFASVAALKSYRSASFLGSLNEAAVVLDGLELDEEPPLFLEPPRE